MNYDYDIKAEVVNVTPKRSLVDLLFRGQVPSEFLKRLSRTFLVLFFVGCIADWKTLESQPWLWKAPLFTAPALWIAAVICGIWEGKEPWPVRVAKEFYKKFKENRF